MIKLSTLLKPELIGLGVKAANREELLAALADVLVVGGVISPENHGSMATALSEREALASTALGKGVAVPHAYLDMVDRETVAFLRSDDPVAFGAGDHSNSDLFFLLTGPSRKVSDHLQLLARTARMARDDRFLKDLRSAPDAASIRKAFLDVESRHP